MDIKISSFWVVNFLDVVTEIGIGTIQGLKNMGKISKYFRHDEFWLFTILGEQEYILTHQGKKKGHTKSKTCFCGLIQPVGVL